MQFKSREDIEVPIDQVFAEITDFQRFERSALRRGAEVQRSDMLTETGVGMSWKARFKLRGRMRDVTSQLVEYDPPNGIALALEGVTMEARMTVDLLALSRARTRLSVDVDLVPRSIAGRLLLQPLKLAKNTATKRFRLLVADYAMDVENRYKSAS